MRFKKAKAEKAEREREREEKNRRKKAEKKAKKTNSETNKNNKANLVMAFSPMAMGPKRDSNIDTISLDPFFSPLLQQTNDIKTLHV